MYQIVFILLIHINLDGIRIQNYEGIFSSEKECVVASDKFTAEKYFESFECKPVLIIK
jgi:hypothetical protein